ncbi:hypothetical protein DAPPUDRAFT_238824 [Daphnia pulex]|uniref:Uncharacterized protein n=1 Tax=Daphnia pulex TaxID=6669 RepID=E9G7H7_DAPPU|nr:hypothetical protein DAPPUDRAFT_238824 [Daphnia pulex]|eukprot:EFX84639.1 hypothetical protein DAPPUDRAFT_238824 [Daphnia pulex]
MSKAIKPWHPPWEDQQKINRLQIESRMTAAAATRASSLSAIAPMIGSHQTRRRLDAGVFGTSPDRAGRLAARLANWLGVKLTGHETSAGAETTAAVFFPPPPPPPPLLLVAWWLVVTDDEEEEEEEVVVLVAQEEVAWRGPLAYDAVWWPTDGSLLKAVHYYDIRIPAKKEKI